MSETPYMEGALEGCVDCEQIFGGEKVSAEVNLTSGPVYDTSGRRYERVMNSDGGSVLLCPDCWEQREIERKQSENASLEVFQS